MFKNWWCVVSEWKWVWWNLKHGPTEKDDEIRELRRALEAVTERELELRRGEWVMQYFDMLEERDKWQAIANRLGTHMGEALYGDDGWPCREYAISAYAEWERTEGAHLTKYEVGPQPVWYFREGKEV